MLIPSSRLAVLFLVPFCAITRAESLRWTCTTATQRWQEMPEIKLGESRVYADREAMRVLVNTKLTHQKIEGWGGCFNERGWKAMDSLRPADRIALLHDLFDPDGALRLDLCRTPIGASDYAIDLYSLNETAGDTEMKHFSLKRDKKWLIPFIQAAQEIQPDLKLWASPWSPPSWMKENGSLHGPGQENHIKDDASTFDALALYFARYIEEYAKEGITISMVMPQNEPNMTTNYTSCLWTGEQMARFIGHHLGPVFEERKLATEIYLGTINDDDDRGGFAYWVEPCFSDQATLKYLAGLGCQWDSAPTMAETHLLHPRLPLMQTESECGNHENDWGFAEYQFGLAQKWFEAGASSNMIWNLVLDETGLSTGGWAQCSPVVIDTRQRTVIRTPYFYLYQHFSHFIEPGSHLAQVEGDWGDKLAFTLPDGKAVVILANRSDQDHPVTLNIDGRRTDRVMLPARSFNTFVTSGT